MMNNKTANNTKRQSIWLSKKPYLWIFCLFCIVTCILFALHQNYDVKHPIDNDVLGTYGDFVGGVLGTAFAMISILLLVHTFKLQQKQADLQRFNDLFFQLINLLQQEQRDIEYHTEGHVYNYKDFFDEIKKVFYNNFEPSQAFSKNRKDAIALYSKHSIVYKSKLSVYYRTIFRLLELIDNAEFADNKLRDYIKILRSQFTENELIFVRYHLKLGEFKRFTYYVNKYNMMKHLPIFELLEFKYWATYNEITELNRKAIDDYLNIIFKKVRKGENLINYRCNNKLITEVTFNESSLYLKITKKPLTPDCVDPLQGLYKYSDDDLIKLFQCVLKELVVFNNFSMYNKYHELSFDTSQENMNDSSIFDIYVVNKKGHAIITKFPADKCYIDFINVKIH